MAPNAPDPCALYAHEQDSVDDVIMQVSTVMGINPRFKLVLVDHWDGRDWTLPRDLSIREAVHQSGNTTFTCDIDFS